MANVDSINPETIKHLDILLNSIASMAITIKELSNESLELCGRTPAAAMACAIESVASQIGYMANMAIKQIDCAPVEEADFWFLPPVCREKEQSATA